MNQLTTFGQPISEIIRRRHSCRSFDGKGIAAEVLEPLERMLAALRPLFGTPLRFGIVDRERVKAENFFSSGTYGMIKGTRFFLTGIISDQGEKRWEDLGYCLETAVLHATAGGLDTCWIGGIFDRKRFGRQLNMKDNELIPAVIAVGRPAERRTLRDRVVRWGARAHLRKDAREIFFQETLSRPLEYEEIPVYREALENVRRAPSASNKQPWRIIFRDGAFHFFLCRDRAYGKLIPHVDLQRIDMGIALSHFLLTLTESGLPTRPVDKRPNIPDIPENFEYIVSANAK